MGSAQWRPPTAFGQVWGIAVSSGWVVLRSGRLGRLARLATGIIDAACRHLAKDRLDLTGARWGLHGAEAIRKLRAPRSNGDFEQYWTFHLNQELHQVHETRYANMTSATAP